METRPFGDSSFAVSALGLGLAALGRPGYINLGHAEDLGRDYAVGALEARAHAVLAAARAAGLRYFDVARSYGRAEVFLGSWLREHTRAGADAFVASKWGYTYTADWQVQAVTHEVKEHSLAVLRRQWDESQANLGGHLRLYQIHSATLESGVLDNPAVLAELARLRAQGVAIGLSVSGARQPEVIRKAVAIRIAGARLFDAVQATWNLLEPSAGAALTEAHATGMAVIVKEALANGRLTTRGAGAERIALAAQAARLGSTPDALALAAALAQPWCTVALSGAVTVEQLHSNLGALAVPWDEEAATILGDLATHPEQYWRERSALPWN